MVTVDLWETRMDPQGPLLHPLLQREQTSGTSRVTPTNLLQRARNTELNNHHCVVIV